MTTPAENRQLPAWARTLSDELQFGLEARAGMETASPASCAMRGGRYEQILTDVDDGGQIMSLRHKSVPALLSRSNGGTRLTRWLDYICR